MKSGWWFRLFLLVVLIVWSVLAIIPSFTKIEESSSYPIKSKINLGLDLQGGLYMILGIDFKKVYKDEIHVYVKKMLLSLEEAGIKATDGEFNLSDINDPKHTLVLANASDAEKAKETIKSFYRTNVRFTHEDGASLEYALSQSLKLEIEQQAVTKSIEVIRNRIDEFGVTEPEILSQGKDRIIVQLPGVKDIEKAKELIGKTAKLEFKIVNDEFPLTQLDSIIEKAEKEQNLAYKPGEKFSDYLDKLNQAIKKDLPKGFVVAFEKKINKGTNQIESKRSYLVEESAQLGGDDLEDARVTFDTQRSNRPQVGLSFKSAAAKKFEKLTGDNVGKQLAIILDGNVYSAPGLNERISGGSAVINLGQGTMEQLLQEAKDISMVLRAGALPVQLDFLEQRTVGPSLGQDSIEKAEMATVVGAIVVFLFILIYYRFSGAIALFCLTVNVLLILAALVAFEATLTLPGIAGIALTVGMGIDGSIIIFERIREEVRKGVSGYKAIEEGFNQAFWTILDANITTALAGFCLLNFGTGPVRGFAVTLLIGIAATVYTSYFAGKVFFDFYMNRVEGKKLSI
jgi:preprotein translocase subunit SecD